MSPPVPPGVPPEMAWFASWISEQFGKIEGKLDSMAKEFITRREYDRLQNDIDRAHQKLREFEAGPHDELEDRVRTLETRLAGDQGANNIRFTIGERISGVILAVLMAGFLAWIGLK